MNDNILILKNLILETKPQGIIRKLKFKHPNIFEIVKKFQIDNNIKSMAESIFLIINDMITPPTCPSLNDKCISRVRFKSISDGYSLYCAKCFPYSYEYREKIKKTNLSRYGVENPMQRIEVKNKAKKTVFEKYGVTSTNQLDSVKLKKKETIQKHFGDDGLSHKSITDKKKKTHIKNCGKEWSTQTYETQEKRKTTCLLKYGVDNVMYLEENREKVRKSLQTEEFYKYVNLLIESRGYHLVSDYTHAHENVTLHCDKCNTDFQILWNSFQQGGGVCPTCYPRNNGSSFQEKEISNYIRSLDLVVIDNDRSIISPLELDIVIPERKIAIEYCGLWCHSSGGNAPYLRDKNYHKNKMHETSSKSYQLITIFEDEWILNKNLVKSRLASILGKSNILHKIRASKCQVRHIDFTTKSKFLKRYHLQGDKVSQINYGLYYENKLVSVMTFSSKNQTCRYELDRFCSLENTIIYGGASKLLQTFKRENEWIEIISFADMRWSIGNVYYKLGFNLDYITSPNYWYWGKGITGRKHRLNFSKKRLVNMNSYDPSLTEFQIMSLEKYAWIYDCGNYKFVMKK